MRGLDALRTLPSSVKVAGHLFSDIHPYGTIECLTFVFEFLNLAGLECAFAIVWNEKVMESYENHTFPRHASSLDAFDAPDRVTLCRCKFVSEKGYVVVDSDEAEHEVLL